jgi:hypothetical protein
MEDHAMATAQKTVDHDAIRTWVEERGGRPARVAATAPGKPEAKAGSAGILRIDFGEPDESLEEISWSEFFDTFEKHKLALLFEDDDSGRQKSRFSKFVARD